MRRPDQAAFTLTGFIYKLQILPEGGQEQTMTDGLWSDGNSRVLSSINIQTHEEAKCCFTKSPATSHREKTLKKEGWKEQMNIENWSWRWRWRVLLGELLIIYSNTTEGCEESFMLLSFDLGFVCFLGSGGVLSAPQLLSRSVPVVYPLSIIKDHVVVVKCLWGNNSVIITTVLLLLMIIISEPQTCSEVAQVVFPPPAPPPSSVWFVLWSGLELFCRASLFVVLLLILNLFLLVGLVFCILVRFTCCSTETVKMLKDIKDPMKNIRNRSS